MKFFLAITAIFALLAVTPANAGAWEFSFNYSSSNCSSCGSGTITAAINGVPQNCPGGCAATSLYISGVPNGFMKEGTSFKVFPTSYSTANPTSGYGSGGGVFYVNNGAISVMSYFSDSCYADCLFKISLGYAWLTNLVSGPYGQYVFGPLSYAWNPCINPPVFTPACLVRSPVFRGSISWEQTQALALGGEIAQPLGHGIFASAFVEGRVGQDNFRGLWGGLKFYFGPTDKPLMARHRQEIRTTGTSTTCSV